METHEKIKELRLLRGLSQEQLAQLTGYSDRSSIAKVEAGKVDLSQSKIASFANALGVTPGELMQITEPTVHSHTDLSDAEWELICAYRLADEKSRAMVDLALSEYKKAACSKEQAG